MIKIHRETFYFLLMASLLLIVGIFQSWSLMLSILNLCLISSIMALGINIQWGYAGLFNVGTMGFAALGGLATILISKNPVLEAWTISGMKLLIASIVILLTITLTFFVLKCFSKGKRRTILLSAIVIIGIYTMRYFSDTAIADIEDIDPTVTGYLGGAGLPILLSWIFGGFLAAGAAWTIGKVALGLRSDYLAIATLGISEIIIAILKNEDWLTRGVKNVTAISRPVPYELDLQETDWFIETVEWLNSESLVKLSSADAADHLSALIIEYSSIYVKLCYTSLFTMVLIIILIMSIMALNSPWGRMMRAIRDSEVAAGAMGKDVNGRHLQVFIIGSAIIGVAGAMLTTLDGQLTPSSYNPLRFTFLIWVMVIVGGSGNNFGAVLGGFLIWFIWIEAEPIGLWFINLGTSWIDDSNPIRIQLINSAQHMRLIMMGLCLLFVMRFNPQGILPEK